VTGNKKGKEGRGVGATVSNGSESKRRDIKNVIFFKI